MEFHLKVNGVSSEVGELVKSYKCRRGDARNGRRFVTSGSAKGPGPTRGCKLCEFLDLPIIFKN